MSVVDSILAHAVATPDATAVVSNGREYNYRTFAALITAAARFIERQSFDRDRVAVLRIGSLLDSWIVALAMQGLGVTTIAARSVDDVAGADLGPVTVFSTEAAGNEAGLAAAAPTEGHPVIVLPANLYDDAASIRGDEPFATTERGGRILLTSGTTGLYKKVLMDASAEADLVAINTRLAGIDRDSAVNVMNFGLWAGAGYTWPTLAWSAGAAVVIYQAGSLWQSLVGVRQTHAVVTPYMLEAIVAAPAELTLNNEALTLLIVGGMLSSALWQATRDRLTSHVVCLYGATETCHMTFTPVEGPADLRRHRIHASDVVQVVDDHDRPQPHGVTGFVRVKANRDAGYLDDAAGSRAFFKQGYFYPGDLGVMSQDGHLTLQGRVTDVINVKGAKIGVIPIETDLQERLGARAVCVFSAPSEDGEIVHVAIQPGRAMTRAELEAAVIAALPGVGQVQVHSVTGFPRNHMGKIERGALRAQLFS